MIWVMGDFLGSPKPDGELILFSICSLVIEKVNAKLCFLIISKISNDNYFITMFEKQRGHTFSM